MGYGTGGKSNNLGNGGSGSYAAQFCAGKDPVIEGGKRNVAVSKLIASDPGTPGNKRKARLAVGKRGA